MCQDCEDRQEGKTAYTPVYVRIDNSQVELVGCPMHVGMLVEEIRFAHRIKGLQT